MIHFYRYISALTVLLASCGLYRVTVAPWLEPPPAQRRQPQEIPGQSPAPKTFENPHAALFPPGHWVHNDPKVLETENCTLLIGDYKPLPDGRLELKPCALVFYASKQTSPESAEAVPSKGRPIILQAPSAELIFDRTVDFKRAEFGKVEKGTLSGDIVIHSPPSAPGVRDDLLIKTQSVWLDRQSIRTSNEVFFQYGDSEGKGRMLEIALAPRTPEDKKASKSKFAGIRSVTLQHLDSLRIATAGRGLLADALPTSSAAPPAEQAPIEVTCQGEFSFDMTSQVARFERQVHVRRVVPGAPPDQLHCEELLLGFTQNKSPPNGSATAAASAADPLAGRLARIIATGSPAEIQAPTSGIRATSAYMEYSLADRYVTLKSDQQTPQATLIRGDQHFVAPQLHYQLAEQGRLGRLHATGPGDLRMVQERPGERQVVTARWQKELDIQPQEQQHVISLVDSASITIDPVGRFNSNELHVWVAEVPAISGDGNTTSAPPKITLVPQRLLATGKVHVVSQQLDVDTPRLEAWFTHVPPAATQDMPPLAPPQRIHEPVQRTGFFPDALPQATIRNIVHEPNPQKFHVRGATIRLRAVVSGRQFQLEDLNIDRQAAIDETRTPLAGQEPIFARGEKLQLAEGTKPQARMQIDGNPAEVGGRGMWLAAGKIQALRGKNEVRIDVPGEATMPAAGFELGDQRSEIRKESPPQKMHIVWQQGLLFDGQTARFAGDVQVRTATQVALTPVLEATLTDRVDFQAVGNPAARRENAAGVGVGRPELARLFLDGGMPGVYLENRGLDEYGDQTSHEQMRARNLVVNRAAGTLHAAGPGWVSSVRRGGDGPGLGPLGAQGPGVLPQGAAGAGNPDARKLTSVHVAFEKEIFGDLSKREVEFRQHVVTTYSPANDFNDVLAADPFRMPPPQMVVMLSDVLKLREKVDPPLRWIEMEASGHTQVRGTKVDVDAPIIEYSSAKETLRLLADGRAKARTWMSPIPGQARTEMSAKEITYNLRTGQLDVESADLRSPLSPNIKLGIPNLGIPQPNGNAQPSNNAQPNSNVQPPRRAP